MNEECCDEEVSEAIELSVSAQTGGIGTTVDPSVEIRIPAGLYFWISAAINPVSTTSSQQCNIRLVTPAKTILLGWIPGDTRKIRVRDADVTQVQLDTGASGGALTVWRD